MLRNYRVKHKCCEGNNNTSQTTIFSNVCLLQLYSPKCYCSHSQLMIITYFPCPHNSPGEHFAEFKCPGGTGNAGAGVFVSAHLRAVQNMTWYLQLTGSWTLTFQHLLKGGAPRRRNECGREGGKVRGWKNEPALLNNEQRENEWEKREKSWFKYLISVAFAFEEETKAGEHLLSWTNSDQSQTACACHFCHFP